jgi:hypothetical protein
MKKNKFINFISVTLIMVLIFTGCNYDELSNDVNQISNSQVFRKVARETRDNGWVYTFVYEGYKDENMDDSTLLKYNFFGMNIRYRYDDDYVMKVSSEPKNEAEKLLGTKTRKFVPPLLMLGEGSPEQARDMKLIQKIIDPKKSVDELLALNPDDYNFETVDKDMFFRLMRQSLTSNPQKENPDKSYWEKPSYAFLEETDYLDGYKFQIAFLQETGFIDEIYIDVLYKTGDNYKDYEQLSDIVGNNTATDEQKQIFEEITKIVNATKKSGLYIANANDYKDKEIGNVDFSRLYTFLNNIHENNYGIYTDRAPIEIED